MSVADVNAGGEGGLYILWLHLPSAVSVRIGAPGVCTFSAGLYAYVGSAQRRRAARLARHLRMDKPLRWHIDCLRPHAQVVGVSCVDAARSAECHLAAQLEQHLGGRRAVQRFGASDCGCPGHLIHFGLTWPGRAGAEHPGGP